MNVLELAKLVDGTIETNKTFANKEINGMYTCDMLSFAMAHLSKDNAWVTIVNNINIVAVSVLTQVSCIVLTENTPISDSVVEKANDEGISIITTSISSFEVCVRFGKQNI